MEKEERKSMEKATMNADEMDAVQDGAVDPSTSNASKVPTRLLSTYGSNHVQRLLHRAFFGVDSLENGQEPVPMNFQQFLITCNHFMRMSGARNDKVFGPESPNLLRAHVIGALPPLNEAQKALGTWLAQGNIAAPSNWHERSTVYIAAVYGDLPLGTLEQAARGKAISSMEALLQQWDSYRQLPGTYNSEEVDHLEKMRDECWIYLREMIGIEDCEASRFLRNHFFPVIGEEHSMAIHLLDDAEVNLREHGTLGIMMLTSLPSSLDRKNVEYNPIIPTMRATMEYLERKCGEENPAPRLSMLASTLKDNPKEMTEVISHSETITWKQLLDLQRLIEEYNLEWAMAATDWMQENE